jgi:hypothetical protein
MIKILFMLKLSMQVSFHQELSFQIKSQTSMNSAQRLVPLKSGFPDKESNLYLSQVEV